MKKTRTFIAVSLPDEITAAAEELSRALAKGVEGVKWVAAKNMHLTVKFLGDVEDNQLHEVCRAVNRATEGFESFELEVATAGAFPSVQRPRTIWIGATAGSDSMVALAESLDKSLSKLGFRRESRKFTPHLTIGRVRQGNSTISRLTDHLKQHADAVLGRISVDEAMVYSSELLPEGPEYHVIGRAALQSS